MTIKPPPAAGLPATAFDSQAMSIPSPEAQVQFLLHLQTLLAEGGFTATYKFALLLALADFSIEQGDDSGAPAVVTIDAIADKFIGYYWRQASPYPGPSAAEGGILMQNTDRQATVIRKIEEVRVVHGDSLPRLKADSRAWHALLRKVKHTIKEQPLWKLQTIGSRPVEFLYKNRGTGDEIELKPGVVFCFRRYYELIHDLVRGAWVRFVRGLHRNRTVLGPTTDLDGFLFGSERSTLSAARMVLSSFQAGRCFYCESTLRGSGEVDHFIPWSLYPLDLGHNFVVAHARCNAAKNDRLAAYEHLQHWSRRNTVHGRDLGDAFDRNGILHDLAVSWRIARWAYARVAAGGGQVWRAHRKILPLDPAWLQLLGRVA